MSTNHSAQMTGGPVTVFDTIADWADYINSPPNDAETLAACIARNATQFNMVPVSIVSRRPRGLSTYLITFRAGVREDLVRFLCSPDGGDETPGSIDKDDMITEVAL